MFALLHRLTAGRRAALATEVKFCKTCTKEERRRPEGTA
jgi:hypothetical protein